MELTPVAAGRLLDRAGFLVRNAAAAANSVELVEELILFDRVRRRIDRAVGIALLGGRGGCDADDQRQHRRRDDQTETSRNVRHRYVPFTGFLIARHRASVHVVHASDARHAAYDAIVSRYAVFQPQAPEP